MHFRFHAGTNDRQARNAKVLSLQALNHYHRIKYVHMRADSTRNTENTRAPTEINRIIPM